MIQEVRLSQVARTAPNTIAKPEITFAMIELADSADCNARRSGWFNYGFKDVTPDFNKQSSVPSLNGANVAAGRQMLEKMASVSADWFMLSGHHGALYAMDYAMFLGADGNVDGVRLGNGEQYCGFFNESYHEGRWDHSRRKDPDGVSAKPPDPDAAKHHADEIYLRTTAPAPSDIAKHPQKNPYFDGYPGTTRFGRCKGIIVCACNTLVYLAARINWSLNFPQAVIFGTYNRIVSGTWVTNAIAGAAMTDENFWRNPSAILDQEGMCEKLASQLMAGYPAGDGEFGICFIYKGILYVPMKNKGKIEVYTPYVNQPNA